MSGGVVHNGVTAFPEALETLRRFRRDGGFVAFITNAPRPASSVKAQLRSLDVGADTYDLVVTSGDVTRSLIAECGLERIYHLGPERDLSFFEGLGLERVSPDMAQAVVCTGLFDDETEEPEDYRSALGGLAARRLPLFCANPDIVVRRGGEPVPLRRSAGAPLRSNRRPGRHRGQASSSDIPPCVCVGGHRPRRPTRPQPGSGHRRWHRNGHAGCGRSGARRRVRDWRNTR